VLNDDDKLTFTVSRGMGTYLVGAVLLALAGTSSTFAYTYANTSVTSLQGTSADGDWATYELSVEQPDWQQIMPNGIHNAEILLPNAPGDETEISSQYPYSGNHWDKVDDIPADDGQTYLSSVHFNRYRTDLYNLTDHKPVEEGVVKEIESVTIFFRFAGFTTSYDHYGYAKPVIKTYGNVYEGKEEVQKGSTYVTRSYEWKENPATAKQWTWEEVNSLQAGISLKDDNILWPAFGTQVYVAVNYEKKVTQSEVPRGNLFDITPHPDYTGDLHVKIYLTNTSELIKAYSYLNMELYVKKSVEALKPPVYRVLSLENGVASFNIEGGSAKKYTVEVWGGAYRLVSSNPTEWGAGWNIVPELYCEVTQR
jgi:hypothetical protein